jgi:hypothetical protein
MSGIPILTKESKRLDQEEWTDKQEDKKLQFPPGLQILL